MRLLPTRLEHGLRISGGELSGERLLPVVRVRTDLAVGYGEAPPLPTFTGQGAAETFREVLAATTTCTDATPNEALRWLHERPQGLSSQARCAVDVALYDVVARSSGVPLHDLLGGRDYDATPVSRAIGFHDLETAVRLARDYHARGIRALKLKVGRDVRTDAGVVAAVREAVGPKVELAIDANEGYAATDAIAMVRACSDADLAYFEQPVSRHDLDGMRAVRKAGIAVMADEAAFDVEDVHALARAEAADLIAIKLIKAGGLAPALDIARAAEEHGLAVVIIDPLGSAVSLNAGLALATTLSGSSYAHGLSAGMDVAAPYAPHLPIKGGALRPSDTPGLGVEVRWSDEGVAA